MPLPQDSGLARHIGSGDDEHLTRVVVHVEIIGNESTAIQEVLDHRMAAIEDMDDAA